MNVEVTTERSGVVYSAYQWNTLRDHVPVVEGQEPLSSTSAYAVIRGWSCPSIIDNVEGSLLTEEEHEEFLEDLRTAQRVMREHREHGLTDTVLFTQFRADRLEAKR